MAKIKMLIDTDIGDDLDDTLALSMALSMQDKIEIIGVTTVFNDTALRAQMVKKLLDDYNYSAPIYAGYGKTEGGFQTPPIPIFKTCPEVFDTTYIANKNPEDAIDFIIDCCYKYKKDLVLLAIGPFTNIHKVIKKDPNALKQIDKVVVMAGAFFKQYADWNVFCDPISAKTMFDNVDNLVALGADVTHLLGVPEEVSLKLINYSGDNKGIQNVAKTCKAVMDIWQGGKITLHDPLALYTAVDDKFVGLESAEIEVVTDGPMAGYTFNITAYCKKHLNGYYKDKDYNKVTVARTVKAEEFIKLFFDTILKN